MMRRLATWLQARLQARVATRRAPDFIVGDDNPDGAYLLRWYLIPRNRAFNVYLHKFLRDDDDREVGPLCEDCRDRLQTDTGEQS